MNKNLFMSVLLVIIEAHALKGMALVEQQEPQNLVQASMRRCVESMRFFLKGGVDPNQLDSEGRLPLVEAIKALWNCPCGRCRMRDPLNADIEVVAECCKVLLDAGANPNGIDATLLTPILAAAQGGQVRIIQLLLESGANVLASDARGRTLLMLAIWGRSLPAFRLLHEWGADAYAQDARGMTALMRAVKEIPDSRTPGVESYIVKYLLEYAVTSEQKAVQFFCCLKSNEDSIYWVAYNSAPIRKLLTKYLDVVSLSKLLKARAIDGKTAAYIQKNDTIWPYTYLDVKRLKHTRAMLTKVAKLCENCAQVLVAKKIRCADCKKVYYCSAACQKNALQAHKLVCGQK